MIVISDTSVISNLIQLGHISLLKQLFGQVIIPEAVFNELSKISNQIEILNEFDWVEIITITKIELFQELEKSLDQGESEAITLAIELKADALLIDEKKGRRIAQEHGIFITGLIGILINSKEENLIQEVKPLLDKLIYEIGFRINPQLYRAILKKVDE